MKDELAKILKKQDEHTEDLTDIKVILTQQEANLKLHIYRTDLAEENIQLLRNDLKPIHKHVTVVTGFLKIMGGFSIAVGTVIGIIKIISSLS